MPKITQMYAYVAEDTGPDDEGIVGAKMGDSWMPLVGADIARVESLKVLAQNIATATGKEVRLVKFAGPVEVVETLTPKSA